MDSQKFFKTAATVLVTAVIQSIIFCLVIGLPLPQFLASRDVESLQFQQLPEQKRTQPIQALENPEPAPAPKPVVKAKPRPKPVETPVVKKEETKENPTKVLVVNFEKPKKEEPKQEEKPTLEPVSEKVAGVQADDSQTEATTELHQNPEVDPSADVIEKSN